MRRVWVWMLVLAFAMVPRPSYGQAGGAKGMLGLPLVMKDGGWARYSIKQEDGTPTEVVFRLGQPDSHKGKKGRWIILELDVPELGRMGLHFLVEGNQFSFAHVLRMRVAFPGKPLQDALNEDSMSPGSERLKLVRKVQETVMGRKLEVTEYETAEGILAGWSPVVPVLGLTRVGGPDPLTLVAFGVGGDPWKGRASVPIWPEAGKKERGP